MEERFIPVTSLASGKGREVAPGVYGYTNRIVNVCFLENGDDWVLVDTGMPKAADAILHAVEKRYGSDAQPKAIILTHGHFDHVGSVRDLAEKWDVSVYAHALEKPYLSGESDYPPGNPNAGGGLVSRMSPMFPHEGIDIRDRLNLLPENGEVPHLPEWEWVHTPGHTPGHISLFRPSDRFLIAGDAFVTVKQESLYNVVLQEKAFSGPPKYFTMDWEAARQSLQKLQRLNPTGAVTGHGPPVYGEELTKGLERLLASFAEIAVPH